MNPMGHNTRTLLKRQRMGTVPPPPPRGPMATTTPTGFPPGYMQNREFRITLDVENGEGGKFGFYQRVNKQHEDFLGTVVRVVPIVDSDGNAVVGDIIRQRTIIVLPWSLLPMKNVLLRVRKVEFKPHESLVDLDGDVGIGICLKEDNYYCEVETQRVIPIPDEVIDDECYRAAQTIKKLFNMKY